jgi:hypothetical protein
MGQRLSIAPSTLPPDKETPDKEALAMHVILGRRFGWSDRLPPFHLERLNVDRTKALRGRCSPIPIFSCSAACSLACRLAKLLAGDVD